MMFRRRILNLFVTMCVALTLAVTTPVASVAGVMGAEQDDKWVSLDTTSGTPCAITSDRTAYCWGSDEFGQVGDGSTGDPQFNTRFTPFRLPGHWRSIVSGDASTCGLQLDDTAWCWGDNSHGELGLGDRTSRLTPARLAGRWRSVTVAGLETCGQTLEGQWACWGLNNFGQLGDGTHVDRGRPVALPDRGWTTVILRPDRMCGIDRARHLWCWGLNDNGELGVGDSRLRTTPTPVAQGNWASVALGRWGSCGIRSDHSGWCWGSNFVGQVGDGSPAGDQHRPVRLPGLWRSVAVDPTWTTNCGVQLDGSGWCWGSNDFGQLGIGHVGDRTTTGPRRVQGGPWSSIAQSVNTGCGMSAGHALSCWGLNGTGQTGTGEPGRFVLPSPTAVIAPAVASYRLGYLYGCLIDRSGSLWCWGARTRVGTGAMHDQYRPGRIPVPAAAS